MHHWGRRDLPALRKVGQIVQHGPCNSTQEGTITKGQIFVKVLTPKLPGSMSRLRQIFVKVLTPKLPGSMSRLRQIFVKVLTL